VAETGKNIERAAELLAQGQLVAIPTETVYGLAANALNEKAVLAVFEAKQRPFFDPLIIHVPSIEAAKHYAIFSDERLLKLAQAFWPGPLTLLLPKKENVPDLVTSGLKEVAVRVPNHQLTLQLLERIRLPLAAPSANPFGYVSPTQPEHVEKQLGHAVAYILDGNASNVGIESTIVGVEDGRLCVFRLGGLPIEDIEKVSGPVELRVNSSSNPRSPGQLKSHYAPKKPLLLGNAGKLLSANSNKKVALLSFGKDYFSAPNIHVYNLSRMGNLEEAALNLFRFLRQADDSDADLVICETLPDEGLGRAINDRLRRAAGNA